MSGNNTPPNPPVRSIRAAALALIAAHEASVDATGTPGMNLALDREGEAWAQLDEALAVPVRSRPVELPDIATALATIDAMKAGEPIAAGGIQAVVELAEEGARQIDQFAARYEADCRALSAWAAAHPDLSLWVPEREDAMVWLMELFDCSFDRPTVDQVDQVRGRLKGAMLRAPNALTKDAGDMIEQLAAALRATMRGKFLAEQRADALARAIPGESALSDHLDALGLLADAAKAIDAMGSIIDGLENNIGDQLYVRDRIEAFLRPADPLDGPAFDDPAKAIRTIEAAADAGLFVAQGITSAQQLRDQAASAEPIAFEHRETHRAGVVERTTIDRIYGDRPGPASDSAFDALVAEARKSGIVDDDQRTVWRQPGEAGALLATKLGQLTGYPIKDRVGPEGAA